MFIKPSLLWAISNSRTASNTPNRRPRLTLNDGARSVVFASSPRRCTTPRASRKPLVPSTANSSCTCPELPFLVPAPRRPPTSHRPKRPRLGCAPTEVRAAGRGIAGNGPGGGGAWLVLSQVPRPQAGEPSADANRCPEGGRLWHGKEGNVDKAATGRGGKHRACFRSMVAWCHTAHSTDS